MNALEHDLEELRELVDGQEPWSHRKRLHKLEDEQYAAELVERALRALRTTRGRQVREWGSFVLAVAAIIVAVLARTHGAP